MVSRCVSVVMLLGALGSLGLMGCAASSRGANKGIAAGTEATSDGRGAQPRKIADTPAVDRTPPPLPTFCDGKPIENVAEKWDNGNQRLLEEVVIGEDGEQIRHGLSTIYWPSGAKKLEMEYHCGVKHGLKMAWYENGEPWSEGEFVNGRDHGTWTVWFVDGTKSVEFTLDHGAWNGLHTVWDAAGRKRLAAEWVHGLRQGVVRIWDPEGVLISQDQYHDNVAQPMPSSN